MKILKGVLPYIIIIAVVIVLRIFVMSPVKVNGTSMDPTLEDKQSLMLDKISYKISSIKRFDIVVINIYGEEDPLIKRVIGLPGEHIAYKGNKLYVNGKYVKEKFEHGKTSDFALDNLGYEEIPKDKYFVVGDNRTNSQDSRSIGLVDKKEIEGKTNFSYYPFDKIGFVN